MLRALSLAFTHSPSCVLLIDSNGVVCFANSAFRAATGCEGSGLTGASITELGHAKTRDNALWRAIETACPWTGQLSLTVGGRPYAGLTSLTPMTDRSGLCRYVLCASERLRLEASSEASAYAQRPTTLVLVVDLDGTILYIDRTVPGITREEAIGSTVFEYVPADHHVRLRSYLAQVVETKSSITFEIPSVGPYGTVLQYRTHVGPIERDGEVVALSFVSWEISEQPPEIEDRYRFLADAGMEGLIIHERNTIIDANPAVCEMFGYECSDLIGRQIADLFAPSSRKLVQRASFYQSGALREATGVRSDGASIRVEVCGKSLPHSSGLATVIAVRNVVRRAGRGASRPTAAGVRRARVAHHGSRSRTREPVDLSIRELDVLELLAQGMTNRAVSDKLQLSARTVDHHVSHILGKLGVPNRTAAAMAARRKGLLGHDK